MKKLAMIVMLICCVFFVSLAIAGEKVVYTVKKGDTLGELMYAWRVQGVEIGKLYSWNQNLGTQIKIGQEIIYNLPDRPEVKRLSEQEVKKIVSETMTQIEKAKVPAVVPKTGNILFLFFAFAVILLLVFLGSVLLLRQLIQRIRQRKNITPNKNKIIELDKFPKTQLSSVSVGIVIKGQKYKFYPEVAKDGRFKTLYKIEPGKFMFVATEEKLKKSLRSSFNKNQELVNDMIKSKRLVIS